MHKEQKAHEKKATHSSVQTLGPNTWISCDTQCNSTFRMERQVMIAICADSNP